MFQDLLIFIASCGFLILAGGILVKSLTRLAQFLKMTEFSLSFIVMALSTSLPELFVGINSALIKAPSIALGTVIGSNIADLTLVAGMAALLGRGLKAETKAVKRDAYWMVAIAITAVFLMYLGKELSRIDAAILLGIFFLHMYRMFKNGRKHAAELTNEVNRWAVLGYFSLFLIALPILYYSSEYVVSSGTNLAAGLALPPIFVGLFFIAIGTSLPELAFETRAVLSGRPGLALGDLIGSVVINSTLVLAVTALITPITGHLFLFVTSSFFMIVVCLLFSVFLESYDKITWKEGTVLLLMYILFLIVELSLKQFYFG